MATLDKFISGVDYGTQLASNIAQTFVSYDKDIIDINKLLLYKSLGFLTQFAGSLPLSAISTAGGIISDIKIRIGIKLSNREIKCHFYY